MLKQLADRDLALERNGDEHREPAACELGLRSPHRVIGVINLLPLGQDPVALNPKRIDAEHIGSSPVPERIQIHQDLVVIPDVFALRQTCPHVVRVLGAVEDHVQILVVVRHMRNSGQACGRAIAWLILAEVGDHARFWQKTGGCLL